MNLTSFSIKNRNCKVVNSGIREYERQAWLQCKYERDNATQAYLQSGRKCVRTHDILSAPQRASGMFGLASSFSVRRLARGIEKH